LACPVVNATKRTTSYDSDALAVKRIPTVVKWTAWVADINTLAEKIIEILVRSTNNMWRRLWETYTGIAIGIVVGACRAVVHAVLDTVTEKIIKVVTRRTSVRVFQNFFVNDKLKLLEGT